VDSTNPGSGATITVSPADVNSAANGTTSFTRTYDSGASVTLTAPATAGGNNFTSWTGCTSASTVTCTVAMSANATVTANYATPPVVLTVDSTDPASGVAIAVSPADLNSASNGTTSFTRTYNSGTSVTLTAPATSGANAFTSWTGCTSVTTVTCTVALSANTTVTANYATPTFALTVNSTNPVSGVSIQAAPADIHNNGDLPTQATFVYNAGASVTLTAPATTAGGNTFSSWTGCASASGVTCMVTLSANTTVVANYATPTFVLTVNSADPASGVAIGVSPADNNSASNGTTSFTRTYKSGTSVTLTAPTTSGSNTFTSWTGCASASTVTCTVTLGANTVVTANYAAPPTISSFVAGPATIGVGEGSGLTAVFANGTGLITPGNLSAKSGTEVIVKPTITTLYTLTVTNSAGTPVTQTTTVNVIPPPTISSFAPTLATIPGGASTSLTAVFAGGTGVVTPGGIAVTSGNAVSVSPTVTTAYTLTVTPTNGTAISQTATVTVTGTTITSFAASPTVIASGAIANLTGVFADGTGMITPGNIPATSGVAVPVSPSTSTVYTLTVTPTSGPAVTQTTLVAVGDALVAVDQSSSGPVVTDQILGMNLAAWFNVTTSPNEPAIQTAFEDAGIKAVRWPGGSWSDAYNWETNTECGNTANSDDTFTKFVNDLVIPAGLDLALTADYGTGENCTGPGDPAEAAAWVANALTLGVTVSHMTVGNEEYGSWETDNHTLQNNGPTYAAAVAGASGYYALIKAASPNTLVGVEVAGPDYAPWDQDVMSGAPYDFVEYHYYPETPGDESDTFLTESTAQQQSAAKQLTANIKVIREELAQWGAPDTPIYVGEIGGPYSNPGKQSWSITQGLYAGQVLGEMMNDGVSRLTWWIGFGNCNGDGNLNANPPDPANFSASLYGWQDFGAYNVFADGPGDTGPDGAPCNYGGPIGTMSPTAEAFNLFKNVAVTGENVLTASVTGDTTNVLAYAATHSGGTALVLFNLNETANSQVTVTLSGQTTATSVTVTTYDKSIYDQTNATPPVWALPTTSTNNAPTLPLSLTLTPWSMNVVLIQ